MCCKKDADSVLNKGGQQWRMSRWRKLKKSGARPALALWYRYLYNVYCLPGRYCMPANFLPICKGVSFFPGCVALSKSLVHVSLTQQERKICDKTVKKTQLYMNVQCTV